MISSVTGKILWKKRVDPPVEPTDKFRSYVYIFSIYDVTGDGVRDVLVDFEYRDYPSGEADGYYLIDVGCSINLQFNLNSDLLIFQIDS